MHFAPAFTIRYAKFPIVDQWPVTREAQKLPLCWARQIAGDSLC